MGSCSDIVDLTTFSPLSEPPRSPQAHCFNANSSPLINLSPNLSPSSDHSRNSVRGTVSPAYEFRENVRRRNIAPADVEASARHRSSAAPQWFNEAIGENDLRKCESPQRKRRRLNSQSSALLGLRSPSSSDESNSERSLRRRRRFARKRRFSSSSSEDEPAPAPAPILTESTQGSPLLLGIQGTMHSAPPAAAYPILPPPLLAPPCQMQRLPCGLHLAPPLPVPPRPLFPTYGPPMAFDTRPFVPVAPVPPEFQPHHHFFGSHLYPSVHHAPPRPRPPDLVYPAGFEPYDDRQRARAARRGPVRPSTLGVHHSYPGFLFHVLAMMGSPLHPRMAELATHGDVENYEALLNLAERLGEAKPRGLLKADIEQLPSYRYNADERQQDEQTVCVICMCDFETKQLLRVLPCNHEFHAKCVDKWLKTNRTCPICRGDAAEYLNSNQ